MYKKITDSEDFSLFLFILDLTFYCEIPLLYPIENSGGWKPQRNLLHLNQWWLLNLGFLSVYYYGFDRSCQIILSLLFLY